MGAAAVIYVADLETMREFYQQCFQLATVDGGPGYYGLKSESWLLTLVQSAEAKSVPSPAPRRAATPIKLGFEVNSIDALRPIVASLGGQVSPADSEWEFRNALHCDCLDPEGNVISLIQSRG
jgi:predicted enzyme related to lactoylglutathione lyase